MTDQQKNQRITALSRCGGVCEVCGKPLGVHAQGAHKIANTEANRRKWGSWIIDSPLNIAMVCSLKCNDVCNIGNDPGSCLELVQKILRYDQNKFTQR
jgi:hypothetical protein